MIKDRIARIKLRKSFHEQRPMSYVGKVTGFSENWVAAHAKGVMLARNQPGGVQIDPKATPMIFPRESIETIRVLPDNFDMNKMQITTDGQQITLIVEGGQNVLLGEMGEG